MSLCLSCLVKRLVIIVRFSVFLYFIYSVLHLHPSVLDIVLHDSGHTHEAREQSERLWIRFFYGPYGLRQGNKRNAREISRH